MALAIGTAGMAKSASQLRIYINPGHGSWTPDDRPATLVGHGPYSTTNTDTTSFFESNTNLRKGFGMLETLRTYGLTFNPNLNQSGADHKIGAARDLSNNIVMSHVKCGPYNANNGTPTQLGYTPANLYYYNRPLAEIAAEVQANNFDAFVSIHSNANTEGGITNYPLIEYRGTDASNYVTGSKSIAQKCWPYLWKNGFNMWTYYGLNNMNIRGDISFYNSSWTNSAGFTGYLSVLMHGVPGILAEGYFHTYQPARHRAMNWDACMVEGEAYARGIADYFGISKGNTGTIYGVLLDKNLQSKTTYYTPASGTMDVYKPVSGATVNLVDAGGNTVATYFTDNNYNGAFVFRNVAPGQYILRITHPSYSGETSANVTVTTAATSQPVVYMSSTVAPITKPADNYPDPTGGETAVQPVTSFKQSYVDENIPALAGKTVRRVIARDNLLYILAHDSSKAPTVVVYDTDNAEVLANVSTAGTQGTVSPLADIQVTADGYLVGCNECLNHFDADQVESGETRGYHRVYRWANDAQGVPTGAPVEMFASLLSGNLFKAYVGHTMAWSGTLANGSIIVPARSFYSQSMFFNRYTVSDGALSSGTTINSAANTINAVFSTLGDDYTFTTSPLDPSSFVVSGTTVTPQQFGFDDVNNGVTLTSGIADNANGASFFRLAGRNYLTAATTSGVTLANLNGALSSASTVSTDGTTVSANSAAAMAAGTGSVERDAANNITAAHIDIFLVRDGKVSKFTTRSSSGTANYKGMNAFAYDLRSRKSSDKEYTIEFNANADAPEAYINLTSTDGSETHSLPIGAVTKGHNTFTINSDQYPEEIVYNWSVELHGNSVARAGEVFSEAATSTSSFGWGGVTVFKDPAYESFGKVLVSLPSRYGMSVYDPQNNKLNSGMHATSSYFGALNNYSPMRVNAFGNIALIACWADDCHPVTAINMNSNPADNIWQFFQGTLNSNGLVSYNGVGISGGTPCVAAYNDGTTARIYTFDEDCASNKVCRYDMPAGTTSWTSAPTKIYNNLTASSYLVNTVVEIAPTPGGFFCSQMRDEGMNAQSVPSLLYSDLDGNILLNGSTIPTLTSSNSGIAVNKDYTKLAIGEYNNIGIYSISWNGNTPSLSLMCEIPTDNNVKYSQISFDYADNLHTYQSVNGSYHVYTLPVNNPVVTTPARTEYAIKGTQTGVTDIEADAPTAPVEYYNLQGQRLDGTPTIPGVYVRKQGSRAAKVVIR